jgi:hypothetical protein
MAFNPSTYKMRIPTISEIAKMAAKKNGYELTDYVIPNPGQPATYSFYCMPLESIDFPELVETKQDESLYAFCTRMGWLPEHEKGETIKDYYNRIKDQYL